jgi:hypothetical protein
MSDKNIAVKHDHDKPRFHLLPPRALSEINKVMEFGAEKYGLNNWRKGRSWISFANAIMRHTWAYISGEDHDKESGLLHLAHIGCTAVFLIDMYFLDKVQGDDRGKEIQKTAVQYKGKWIKDCTEAEVNDAIDFYCSSCFFRDEVTNCQDRAYIITSDFKCKFRLEGPTKDLWLEEVRVTADIPDYTCTNKVLFEDCTVPPRLNEDDMTCKKIECRFHSQSKEETK